MVLINKCISHRNCLLRYPEFSEGEKTRDASAKRIKKKEIRTILGMNNFYTAMVNEIISYCTELTAEHPRAMYLMDTKCTLGNEPFSLPEGAEIPISTVLTVHITLSLRLRPNPTKHKTLIHTWKNGYLIQ